MSRTQSLLFLPITRLPTQYAEEIHTNISNLNDKISECDQQINTAKAQMIELQDRIDTLSKTRSRLRDEVLEQRVLLAPIIPSRIPAEILGEIFEFYVADTACSPFSLTKICRAWRQIALASPRIWGHITLLFTLDWYSSGRKKDGSIVCRTVEKLQRVLALAKKAPLDITMFGSPLPDIISPQKLGEDFTGAHWEMLGLVGGSRMHQWRSLKMVVPGTTKWGTYFEGDASLRRLQSIEVQGAHPALSRLIAGTSKSIQNVYITTLDGVDPLSRDWLKNTEVLRITKDGTRQYHSGPETRLEHLGPLLGSLAKLKDLEICLAGDRRKQSVPFPKTLRRLHLTSDLLDWTSIIRPSSYRLTHLTLRQHNRELEIKPAAITLPKLVYLKCLGASTITGLQTFVCPKLDCLEIESGRDKSATDVGLFALHYYMAQFNDDDDPSPFPVRKLIFTDLSCSYKTLHSVLKLMPSVKKLSIAGESLPKTFYGYFCDTEIHGRQEHFAICPSLEHLNLEQCIQEGGPRFSILKAVVRLRASKGLTLKSLLLLSNSNKKIDLVAKIAAGRYPPSDSEDD